MRFSELKVKLQIGLNQRGATCILLENNSSSENRLIGDDLSSILFEKPNDYR